MSGFYHVTVGSLPEYEDLVAEIYINGKFVGLLSQEAGLEHLTLELASTDETAPVKIDLAIWERAILEAKERLWALRKTTSL